MRDFTKLFYDLDSSNRTSVKLAVLKSYFEKVDPSDGAWAIYFLSGNRLKRAIKLKDFREWAGQACGYPTWMVEECYNHVGDLAETLALLLHSGQSENQVLNGEKLALHTVIETKIIPLKEMDSADQKSCLLQLWDQLDSQTCFIFNKLITGGFRVGVSKTLVQRALAEVAQIEPAVMAHRLMGKWLPSPENFKALLSDSGAGSDPAQPYPFCLAYPLEVEATQNIESQIGPTSDWQIEWKWDGIRAQLIKRQGECILWSRGEEIVSEQFPEICNATAHWPDGVVLDGEILAWDHTQQVPMHFSALQRRLGRKKVGPKLLKEVPVIFMAYDLLEHERVDLRSRATHERRKCLASFCQLNQTETIQLSEYIEFKDWDSVAAARKSSRERQVEGFMLKKKRSVYHAGRKKGEWWKWKVDPYTVDAVLVYAQQGHGRRAGLYTDYTFSIWDGDLLVPFAKAYSGLTDKEIRKVDKWIRAHTRDKHGPVRVVDPELVFEIAFEGISESKRHKSGIAVRFPRMHRWREDKQAKDADSLKTIRALLD
jgi:DNA ligase-1